MSVHLRYRARQAAQHYAAVAAAIRLQTVTHAYEKSEIAEEDKNRDPKNEGSDAGSSSKNSSANGYSIKWYVRFRVVRIRVVRVWVVRAIQLRYQPDDSRTFNECLDRIHDVRDEEEDEKHQPCLHAVASP